MSRSSGTRNLPAKPQPTPQRAKLSQIHKLCAPRRNSKNMESQQTEVDGKMESIDEVGFKRPPVHSRFRKGCSGNSKGRPKGTKNLRTDLSEVLQERITVPMGDRKVRIS